MKTRNELEKYMIGAIILAVLGVIFIIVGFNRAHTFFGYYFDVMSITFILIGFFWIGGSAFYGVKMYKAKTQENGNTFGQTQSYGQNKNPYAQTAGYTAPSKTAAVQKEMFCAGCGRKIPVPAGYGTMTIHCPHCHTQFKTTVS